MAKEIRDISDPQLPDDTPVTREECAKLFKVHIRTWDSWVLSGAAPKKASPTTITSTWWCLGEIRKFLRGEYKREEV